MRYYQYRRVPGSWLVVPATLSVALLLNTVGNSVVWPDWARYAAPDWVTLVLFYWCLATPRWVGVGWGWAMGLVLDLMQYSLFGQHAVGKALVALVAVGGHQRLRMVRRYQQCVVVLGVAAVDTGVVRVVYQVVGDVPLRWEYWQGAVSTALLWPVVYGVLRRLRRHSGIVRR